MISSATRFLGSLACLCLPLAASATSQVPRDVPGISPGERFVFSLTPNAVGGACDSVLGSCNWIPDETPLRAFSYGIGPGALGSSSVHEDHEFTVPETEAIGGQQGSIVRAAVTGSVEVGGFLYATGGAGAYADIGLKLLDITKDPDAPELVWSGSIASYAVEASIGFSVGAAASVEVQGGFPYVGASGGGEVGVELGISYECRILRNEPADFSFELLLRRGRTYRLQLDLTTLNHNRVVGGISIASFFSSAEGGPVVPNPTNPDPGSKPGTEVTGLSMLTQPRGGKPPVFRGRVGNYGLRKADADLACGDVLGFTRNIWEQGLANPFNQLSSGEASSVQSSDKAIARVFGTPSGGAVSPGQLVSSDFMRVENDEENEVIDLPGVQLTSLVLMLDNDLVELQRIARIQQIELNLIGALPPASDYLPTAQGGALEDVLDLVEGRIAQHVALGLPLNNAPYFQNLARAELADGRYRHAYSRARKAYHLLVKEP